MGVLYFVINLDKKEYIYPYDYVNVKDPTEAPYSSFITWVIKNNWNGDAIMFMGDCNPCADGWIHDSDNDSRNKTEEYWKEYKDQGN